MQDSTLMGCELDGVPGFVPRLQRDPGIGLFRSDERVFVAMLHGWRAQMLARGLVPATIKARCAVPCTNSPS
jgi:integrase/recombinase XerD